MALVSPADASKNAVNVSNSFERLSFFMFIQALGMFVCCIYQLLAIFCFKQMFRYRMIVSRINKLNLLFGTFLLALAYYYRLSAAGKLCSGAHLTDLEKADPSIANKYLIEEGKMFIGLITSSWVFVTSAIIGAITLGITAYLAFK